MKKKVNPLWYNAPYRLDFWIMGTKAEVKKGLKEMHRNWKKLPKGMKLIEPDFIQKDCDRIDKKIVETLSKRSPWIDLIEGKRKVVLP